MTWLLLIAGCFDPDLRAVEREEEVLDEMDAHHDDAVAARDAVIAGDLAAAKAAAARLGERLPLAGLPDTLEAKQRELAEAAKVVAGAESLRLAAFGVGEMARSCGGCHAEVGADLSLFASGPAPGAAEGVAAEMARHRWAADRMWEGLVLPSRDAFDEAVQVLSQASLAPSGTPADSPLPPLVVELEVQVHDLAARTLRDPDRFERAQTFGELLATCTACHQALRAGPAEE